MDEYFNSSPVNFITSSSAPTIFFHGTADDIVPVSQSYILQSKREELDVKHDYMIFQGAGHGLSNSQTTSSLLRTIAFLMELGV